MYEIEVQQIPRVNDSADTLGRGRGDLFGTPDELLELVFHILVQLQALLAEDLESVVSSGIVRRRNHDPGREVAGLGDEGQSRGGHHADQMDVGPDARCARDDRRHEHVPRETGVLADHDCPAFDGEQMRGRPTQRVGKSGFEIHVGNPADAIRAEQSGQRELLHRWRGHRSAVTATATATASETEPVSRAR